MGLKYLAGTAMVITAVSAASVLAGCQAGVYGPPPDVSAETSSAQLNPTVYGPPEDMTAESISVETLTDPELTETFEPEPDVYGPPEDINP